MIVIKLNDLSLYLRTFRSMKKLVWILLPLLHAANAQVQEIGFGGGITTIISDLGPESFFNREGYYVTGIFKANTNEWVSVQFSLSYAEAQEHDSLSASIGRRIRNWSSQMSIFSLDMMIQYNFLPANPYRIPQKVWVTPYLAAGLGAYASFLSITDNIQLTETYNEHTAYIPVAFGIKIRFPNRMKLIYEIKPQYSFKDNLEGSLSFDSKEFPKTDQLNNDWMIYQGLTLTFGWGKLPCYLNLF